LQTNFQTVYGRRSRSLPKAMWTWCNRAFLLPLTQEEAEASRVLQRTGKKRGVGDHACQGYHRQPTLPPGVVLMASASMPAMPGWGNLYYASLPGTLGLSPRHGGGLRALVLFGRRVAGMADSTRQRAGTFSVFLYLVLRNFPPQIRFLVRPQRSICARRAMDSFSRCRDSIRSHKVRRVPDPFGDRLGVKHCTMNQRRRPC
jgi:hypothetical protein